jgi:hypothetical protein
LCRSYSGGANVYHFRPDPSDRAFQHLAGPGRRVPVLAARPDTLRGRLVIRFVRNDQHDVLFHRLTLPERVQPRRGRDSLSRADTRVGAGHGNAPSPLFPGTLRGAKLYPSGEALRCRTAIADARN